MRRYLMIMANKLSFGVLVFCYLLMTGTAFFFYPKWKQTRTEATISWDVSGYYMYLPALFIYKDIKKCSFKDDVITRYYPTPDFHQAFIHKRTGNYVMKYASGQAVTMLPFFLLAHTYCKLNPACPADGFSAPYQFGIGVGMLLYGLLGLYVLRKILICYFKDTTVAVLLLCYVVGTNYLNYAVIDQAMTHSVLFTIYCLIIYSSIQFYLKPSFARAFAIGLLVGLAALIRPTDIISGLIPLLWNIDTLKDISARLQFLRKHLSRYILMGSAAFAVFSIQMIYWKLIAGEWLVYSYEEQGFSWLHPHIADYTWSYCCGWLRYCPMMILPALGLLLYLWKGPNRLAVVGFSILNFYIVTSWDIWDYGSTAGRAMVQAYPILAFPFCLLIGHMASKRATGIVLAVLVAFCSYLNIWWTYHAHLGNIQTFDLSKAYYWKVIGTWQAKEGDKKLLDNPDAFYGTPQNVVPVYFNSFDQDTSVNKIQVGGNNLLHVSRELSYTTPYTVANNGRFGKWVRASADFRCVFKEWDVWKQSQFVIQFKQGDEVVQSNMIRIQRHISDGETKNIYLDALVPEAKWTQLSVYVWNAGGDKDLYIDNLSVITFEE